MFWGWFSFGSDGVRRGGGCIFLPFMLFCGMFYMLDNFNSGWLMPMIIMAVLWFSFWTLFNRRDRSNTDETWQDEKPKRDLSTQKPKRGTQVLLGDDGELIEE